MVLSPTVNRHKLLLSISGPFRSTEVYLYPKGPRLRTSVLRNFRIQPQYAHGLMVQIHIIYFPLQDSICRWNYVHLYFVKEERLDTQYLSWFILRNIVAGTHLMMPMNLENDVNKQDHFDNMCVCIHKTTRRVVVMVCILLYLIILISQIKRKPHNTKICIYIDSNYWNFISMSWTWSTEIPCLFSLTHCHRNRVIFSALASTCGLLSCKYLSLKRYS